jgi:hypothetical protein
LFLTLNLGRILKFRFNFSEPETMTETKLLDIANPLVQASLARENIPDPMDAEQTWPTEEEITQSKIGKFTNYLQL